jgi:hypothetical protein
LLTRVLGKEVIRKATHPPEEFYPIPFGDFWKVFLPEYRDECIESSRNAKAIHLWNNIIDRLGFWKDMLPPEGSYLHMLYTQRVPATSFVGIYPDYILRRMIESWHMRQNGKDLGIGSIIKQFVPSIYRTARHHFGRLH